MKIINTEYTLEDHYKALQERIIELELAFTKGRNKDDPTSDDIMDVEYLLLVSELIGLRRRLDSLKPQGD